jgi:MFS family permease
MPVCEKDPALPQPAIKDLPIGTGLLTLHRTMPTDVPDPQRPDTASPTLPELEREVPGGYAVAGHDPYAALRLQAFRRFVAGVTLSRVGQEFLVAALGWEIATRSVHPAFALSMVGLLGALPVILLALPAGHLADSVDRKLLASSTAVGLALCSAALGVVSFYHLPLVWLYLFFTASTTMGAIGGPAHSSLKAQIVPVELYSNATTWSSSFFQIASMVGPALAGALIALKPLHLGHLVVESLPLAYEIDAASCIALAVLLALTPVRPIVKSKEAPSIQTLLAGIRFVWVNNIILATITLDLFAVLLGGATYLLPIYARSILHVGPVGFGWMRAAPAIGALSMAMLVAHLPPMKHAGRNLLYAVIGFGLATIVFGLSRSFALSLLMLFLTGAFDNISVVVRHTLVQVLTPDEMRGRVSAVNNVFIGASNELGGFESGLTAQIFGPIWSVVGGGIGTILVVLAANAIWPQVRQFGSLEDAKAPAALPTEIEAA